MTFKKAVQLISFVANTDEDINLDAPLKSIIGDGNGDSLDYVDFMVELDFSSGTKIPDDKMAEFITVRDLVTYLATNA